MKRALIVIDVQQEYVIGELPIAYPPIGTSLERIGCAMDTALDHGLPIVVVRQKASPGSPIFDPEGPGFPLHPVASARRFDHLIDKALPSALAGTGLCEWLDESHIDTLTLVGYMTQNCIDATARHALHAGFSVEVLSDATGSPHYANAAGSVTGKAMHTASLVALHARFASVSTTEDWAEAVRSGIRCPSGSVWSSTRDALAERRRLSRRTPSTG